MRCAAILLAALSLTACNTFEDDAQRAHSRTTAFTFPASFTTSDVRIITERPHPITHQPVVCTEPSPDVAKAISTAFALSGQGTNGTASGSLAASGSSAEAVAELAGRSTALLGLRDGLFQACQAYANGVIGADIYALIVSRYGQLMTTLFLGQDIAGIQQPSAQATSPPVTATATTAPGSSGNSTASATVPGTTPPGSQPGTAPNPTTGAATALVRMNEDYLNLDHDIIHMLAVVCINQGDPTTLIPADPNSHYRQSDPWLTGVCDRMKNMLTVEGLQKLATMDVNLVRGHFLAPPVDPAQSAAPPPAKASAPPPKKASAPQPAKKAALPPAKQ